MHTIFDGDTTFPCGTGRRSDGKRSTFMSDSYVIIHRLMAQTTLFTRAQIDARVAEMGQQISADFAGTEMIALCVLKGAVFFCTDLMRSMSIDVALDFIQVSSYGNQKYSSGVVTILKEPQLDMRGKNVLIVEDIIDSGLSMREVFNYIESRGAAKVKTASFLDKPGARKVPFAANYVGF